MRALLNPAVAGFLLILATASCGTPALAQHNHERGHNDYLGWASGVTTNCCNNQDCGLLKDDEVRDTTTGTQVKIDGQWCPVERRHYITKGKSPDWNVSHACIKRRDYFPDMAPCDRLLCFSGRGGV